MSFTLAIAALLPALLMVWYVVRRDLYPEPAPVLLGAFLLGGLAVLPAGMLVSWVRGPLLAEIGSLPIAALVNAFVIVGPVEESLKFTVLAAFAGRRSGFNEPMDGLVYGGVIGLGFATAENLVYVMAGGLEVAFLRATTAVPMHAAVGVIMGFFYGLARFHPERGAVYAGYALLAAIGLHGAYNMPLILNDLLGGLGRDGPWLPSVAIGVLAFQIGLALALLRRVRRSQRAGHHEAAPEPAFHTIDLRFRRFSTRRHMTGPAAVALGGLLVWLTGTGLLTLGAGLLGHLLDAHPESPVGRAEAAAEDALGGAGAAAAAMAWVLLVGAFVFGLWLFGRGISWLNRHDRPIERAAAPESKGSAG